MFCKNCGKEVDDNSKFCQYCGYSFSQPNQEQELNIEESISDTSTSLPAPDGKKKFSLTKNVKIVIAIVAVILCCIGYISIEGPLLMGDEKIAYELVYNHADGFKEPSSVRISSGCVVPNEHSLFCGISANNSYGARTTSYYYISDSGIIESDYDGCKYKGELNYEKINKKLEKKLKRKY